MKKMAIDYKLLGERIKMQRLSKGTTQEHFAEHMNVSVGYISQMERGITKISLERLSAISEYLDCDMVLLLEGAVLTTTGVCQKILMHYTDSFLPLRRKC